MRKRRGEPSERVVEPMTVRLSGGVVCGEDDWVNLDRSTEVMIMWGTL